jgi:AraC-like DNA-binding protein
MKEEPTSLALSFRVGSSFSLPAILQSLGQSPDAVFEAAGVDPALYSHPENRIAAVDLGRLFSCASQMSGRTDIGLLVANGFHPTKLGLVGELAAEGPDVDTALRNLVRLLRYNTLAGYPTLSVGGAIAALGFDLRLADFVGSNFILEGATGIAFRFMQWLCGDLWVAEEIHFSRRSPSNSRPFRDFFGMPVRFSATEDAVLFSADWLKRHVVREEHRKRARRLEIAAAPFTELVRRVVAIRLGFSQVDSQNLASVLGVSERQLFRRLKSEGTTCQQLVDDVKFSRARHLLQVGDAPIAAIAFALGYSDQSSFTRAFARWSGIPPHEWRKAH